MDGSYPERYQRFIDCGFPNFVTKTGKSYTFDIKYKNFQVTYYFSATCLGHFL